MITSCRRIHEKALKESAWVYSKDITEDIMVGTECSNGRAKVVERDLPNTGVCILFTVIE